ncbi:hypothetical protein PTTG_06773 [Puccinia triticina 1-1 BBBD Race 1]|uniref:Uncharacterized protein n=2 Tax=Puccinia triticina TaxID=208348 RepID=A0A180G5D4_PUCT1|nr:uncharacterized protein PtA15_4A190 [Puccinia triticina]OAV87881.1 hypothetical protein PTTG_06773 [Puccinia triticina 1-1 BBBD Race 1]WAQ83742.1 hypothetical protein PtA15_4A190 [Puccinia triticina]WAR54583.1 hypothetical protein PtB15_4B200 [Puccinia triticina]
MLPHSLDEDQKSEETFTHQLTHVLTSEECNSSWDKIQNTARRTMLITSPQRSNPRFRTFLLISLLVSQSFGVIGFFTSVFISLGPYVSSGHDRGYQAMLGYLVIFTIATVFEVYIAIDSLLSQNAPQLFALCLFEGSMTGFGAMLPHQIHKALKADEKFNSIPPALMKSIDWRLYSVPAIIGVTTLIMTWLTWHFSQEFGWHAFKKLGANIALRRAMRVKSIFYMLQKFNFFFLIGFCVLIVQMRKQSQQSLETLDVILPSLALVATCLVQLFASIAVELELRFFIFLYGMFWSAAMLFMGYEIIEIHPLSEATDSQHSLILFSSLTILLLFSTGIMSIFCFMNFNKGLKGAEDSYIVGLFHKKASFQTSAPHSIESRYKLELRAVLD